MDKLRTRLSGLGSIAAVPDLNRFLDSDGDGVVNTSDNCPLTANASQAPVTNAICRVKPSITAFPDHAIVLHAVGDFFHDGKRSVLVLANSPSRPNARVAYYLPGLAGGGLGAPRAATFASTAPTMNFQGVVLMDVTGDGLADLYLGHVPGLNQSEAGVVYPSSGAGGFAAALHTGMVGTFPGFLGFLLGGPPVIAANTDSTLLNEIIGVTSAGGLLQQTYTGTAGKEWSDAVVLDSLASFQLAGMRLASGNFNGDGKVDLVAVGTSNTGSTPQFVVGLGDGAGHFTFGAPVRAGTGNATSISCINVVDVDGDGKRDLAFKISGPLDVMAWSRGDGTDGFGAVTTVSMSLSSPIQRGACEQNHAARFVADVTGDGKPDFVGVTMTPDGLPALRVLPTRARGSAPFRTCGSPSPSETASSMRRSRSTT